MTTSYEDADSIALRQKASVIRNRCTDGCHIQCLPESMRELIPLLPDRPRPAELLKLVLGEEVSRDFAKGCEKLKRILRQLSGGIDFVRCLENPDGLIRMTNRAQDVRTFRYCSMCRWECADNARVLFDGDIRQQFLP